MQCDRCGEALEIGVHPFCPHGRPIGGLKQIGDECDFWDPNFERRFTSKAEHDRVLKEHGLVRKVRHVGIGGSDKSRFSKPWVSVPTISEEDRIAGLRAFDERHGLTAAPKPVEIIVPPPAPAFTADEYADLHAVAAQVGL